MGGISDFNGNARGVQGGVGFAGNPPNPNIYAHGLTEGASESLDLMTLWVQTIRPLNMPKPSNSDEEAGRAVFGEHCASCHGGPKWTKSQVIYDNNPTFDKDPVAAGGVVLDPRVKNAGPQIRCFTLDAADNCNDPDALNFLEDVGTFNANVNIEVRGQAPFNGQGALGGLGFNVPSLLGIGYTAPYLHNGSARTLERVFELHQLGNDPDDSIADVLSGQDLGDLETFLKSVDGRTIPFRSETDEFLDSFGD